MTLQFIPQSISSRQSENSDLNNNKIEDFPMGVLDLPLLKTINRQNLLKPDRLSDLKVLKETLSVSSNQLTLLPKHHLQYTFIEEHLRQREQNHYGGQRGVCVHELEKLNLANNKLVSVPIAWQNKWESTTK